MKEWKAQMTITFPSGRTVRAGDKIPAEMLPEMMECKELWPYITAREVEDGNKGKGGKETGKAAAGKATSGNQTAAKRK